MNNIISERRILLLLKKDIYSNISNFLTTGAALSALVILLSLFTVSGSQGSSLHYTLFRNILFLGGFIIAGRAFTDLYKKETVQGYLMLPASVFEKFITRLFLVSILYATVLAAGYTAAASISELLNYYLFERTNALFNPFSPYVLKLLPDYIITQSIFFLGGLYFRSNSFIKTIAFLGAAAIVLSITAAAAGKMIFSSLPVTYFSSSSGTFHFSGTAFTAFSREAAVISEITKWAYLLLAAPFCWVTAFFRFREAEVRHGV